MLRSGESSISTVISSLAHQCLDEVVDATAFIFRDSRSIVVAFEIVKEQETLTL
jgi:hypothetical protein